jgi:hypothetical protein
MTDNLSVKVKEICPYYIDLEEKFFERAGIKPSATSDEIFRESDDDEVFEVETYNGEETEEGKKSDSDVVNDKDNNKDTESTRNQAAVNGSKTYSHLLGSAKKSKGQPSAKRRKTNKESGEMNGFNALMLIARRKNAELEASQQTKNDSGKKVDSIVHLMEKWKNALEAMGCPIKAAYACTDFEQFLDCNERKQLRRYQREMEAPLSSDSSED